MPVEGERERERSTHFKTLSADLCFIRAIAMCDIDDFYIYMYIPPSIYLSIYIYISIQLSFLYINYNTYIIWTASLNSYGKKFIAVQQPHPLKAELKTQG